MIALPALLLIMQDADPIGRAAAATELTIADATGKPSNVERLEVRDCKLTATTSAATHSFDLRRAESVELDGEILRVQGQGQELAVTGRRDELVQDQAMQTLVKAVHGATLVCLSGKSGS